MEKLIKICEECGVEFCHGNCSKFDYDLHKEDILDIFQHDLGQMGSQKSVGRFGLT